MRVLKLNPYFGRPIPDLIPWAAGQVVPLASLVGIAALFGWIVFALIRWSPKRWWAWSSGAVSILAVGQLALQPVVSDLRSNMYVPIQVSEYSHWQDRLEAIASRAGRSDVPIVVWQTTDQHFCRIQNSVVGLGPTRRVVLADQIFSKWDAGQVEAAFAHELKHYLFDNTWIPAALIVLLSVSGGAFVYMIGNLVCRRLGQHMRFYSLGQPAAFPLILLLIQVYILAVTPAFNLTAQYVELEADRFALEVTKNNEARARVSADQCGRLWLPEDTLFARLYLHTHPSVAKRIRLANEYSPWDTGGQLVYGDVISFH
jgi:Zn-dependent protease with chaperone function